MSDIQAKPSAGALEAMAGVYKIEPPETVAGEAVYIEKCAAIIDRYMLRQDYMIVDNLRCLVQAREEQIRELEEQADADQKIIKAGLDKIVELTDAKNALGEQVEKAKALSKRLASDALIALAGSRVPTPERGYLVEPHCLPHDIEYLRKERDEARKELDALMGAASIALYEIGESPTESEGVSNLRDLTGS